MVNPSKSKGTNAETAVVRYMRANGFGGADRQPLRGNRDAGDIALTIGIVLEVKSHKGSPGLGQPAEMQLAAWMGQASLERYNARADLCPLIVKRAGTADPGRWFAYLTLGDLMHLTNSAMNLTCAPTTAPVCMSVNSLVTLLRSAGHGDALETDILTTEKVNTRDPDVDDATAHTATNINTLGEALFTLAGGYDQ